MTTLRSGSATHVGQVRSNNQDSFLVLAEADLFGVADGMGGHNGGEVASAMAVEHLQEHAGEPSLENLKQAARIGNRAIFEKAGADPELHGMGTTLCAVRVVPGADGQGDEIAWINVGDSRVYLFRDDALIQLSRDHSLVEDLLRDGQLTEDEAKVHPKRNIITRALGIDVDVDVDGSTVIPFNGDRFLLCSDGLFGEVSADQISSVLRRLADPSEAAEELVRLANEGGGRDNITVVVVEVVDDDGRSLAASEALAAETARLKAREGEGGAIDDEADTQPSGDADPYVPVFADRKSSLPDAPDAFASDDGDDGSFDVLDGRPKRFTWRVLIFVVALLVVAGVVVGSVLWKKSTTYYLAVDGQDVVLYQGDPDGSLTDPKATTLSRPIDELRPAARQAAEDHRTFSSIDEAETFLFNNRLTATSTTTTSTSTTSTTKPTVTSTTGAATSTTAATTPSTSPTP